MVIPCWKCDDTIQRALESIVKQTCQPAEVIIVDDASGCSTKAALNQICERLRMRLGGTIKVIVLPIRTGPAGARNHGWQTATCPYVAFLDADDTWHLKKIEIQHAYMESRTDVTLTGHRTVWLKPNECPPALEGQRAVRRVHPREQLVCNRFHTRSVMVRREIPFRFETAKRYSEDYLLWSEILLNGFNGGYLDLPLAYTFKPQYGAMTGLSANLWAMEKGELDTYYRLYNKSLISFVSLVGLVDLSALKFIKRLLLARLVYGAH